MSSTVTVTATSTSDNVVPSWIHRIPEELGRSVKICDLGDCQAIVGVDNSYSTSARISFFGSPSSTNFLNLEVNVFTEIVPDNRTTWCTWDDSAVLYENKRAFLAAVPNGGTAPECFAENADIRAALHRASSALMVNVILSVLHASKINTTPNSLLL